MPVPVRILYIQQVLLRTHDLITIVHNGGSKGKEVKSYVLRIHTNKLYTTLTSVQYGTVEVICRPIIF